MITDPWSYSFRHKSRIYESFWSDLTMVETGRLRPSVLVTTFPIAVLVTTFPIAGIKYPDQTFRKEGFLLGPSLRVQLMCHGKHSGRSLRRMVTLYLSAGEQRRR